MKRKKLYRSNKDKIIFGIFGGIGEYFSVDSSLLRLFWILVVMFTGIFPGIIVYLFSYFIVPKERS